MKLHGALQVCRREGERFKRGRERESLVNISREAMYRKSAQYFHREGPRFGNPIYIYRRLYTRNCSRVTDVTDIIRAELILRSAFAKPSPSYI